MAVLEEVEATASVGRAAVTLLPPQTAPARPNAAFDVYQELEAVIQEQVLAIPDAPPSSIPHVSIQKAYIPKWHRSAEALASCTCNPRSRFVIQRSFHRGSAKGSHLHLGCFYAFSHCKDARATAAVYCDVFHLSLGITEHSPILAAPLLARLRACANQLRQEHCEMPALLLCLRGLLKRSAKKFKILGPSEPEGHVIPCYCHDLLRGSAAASLGAPGTAMPVGAAHEGEGAGRSECEGGREGGNSVRSEVESEEDVLTQDDMRPEGRRGPRLGPRMCLNAAESTGVRGGHAPAFRPTAEASASPGSRLDKARVRGLEPVEAAQADGVCREGGDAGGPQLGGALPHVALPDVARADVAVPDVALPDVALPGEVPVGAAPGPTAWLGCKRARLAAGQKLEEFLGHYQILHSLGRQRVRSKAPRRIPHPSTQENLRKGNSGGTQVEKDGATHSSKHLPDQGEDESQTPAREGRPREVGPRGSSPPRAGPRDSAVAPLPSLPPQAPLARGLMGKRRKDGDQVGRARRRARGMHGVRPSACAALGEFRGVVAMEAGVQAGSDSAEVEAGRQARGGSGASLVGLLAVEMMGCSGVNTSGAPMSQGDTGEVERTGAAVCGRRSGEGVEVRRTPDKLLSAKGIAVEMGVGMGVGRGLAAPSSAALFRPKSLQSLMRQQLFS